MVNENSSTSTPVVRGRSEDRQFRFFVSAAFLICAGAFYGIASNKTLLRFFDFYQSQGTAQFMYISASVLFGIAGLAVLFFALRRTYEANCPICMTKLKGLNAIDNKPIACGECHKYVEGSNSILFPTAQDSVRPEPTFQTRYENNARFPERCCVCGEPYERSDDYHWSDSWVRHTGHGNGNVKTAKFSASVPYCGKHSNAINIAGFPGINATIWFRSYAVLLEFCTLNSTLPGQR
jgi:hypothetical protein